MATTLIPIITGTPGQPPSYNVGMAETFSWIPIDNNANRPLFARAGYITNLKDISISLSASNVNIGGVELVDPDDHNIRATIIALGGSNGNALQVRDVTPSVTAVNILNTAAVSGSVTVLNTVSAVSITNQLTGLTVLNSVTAVSLLNQLSSYSVTNPTTGVQILNTAAVSGSITVLNTVSAVSVTNQLTGISVTNDVQVHASGTFPVSGSVTITNPVTAMNVTVINPISAASLVTFADSYQLDQSGRLRVSQLGTQWWYTPSVDKDGDLRMVESFTAGGSSIFVQNLASVNMTSGTTSVSGKAIRATRRRHKVRPGVGHQWFGTFNWDGLQDNVVKREGLFTAFNGFFFELSGGDMNVVVRRRLIDGSLVEERVPRSQFNGDVLNGLGTTTENWNLTTTASVTGHISTTTISIPGDGNVYNVVYGLSAGQASFFKQGSKLTVTGVTPSTFNGVALVSNYSSVTNTLTATYVFNPGTFVSLSNAKMNQSAFHMEHTYWFDFIGGRTDRVRFGKSSNHGPTILHTFNFNGSLGTQYENAPALMARSEIFNTGAVAYLPSLTLAGHAFNVEAETEISPAFGVAYNNTPIAFTTDGQEYPVLGIGLRVGEPYQRATLQVQSISLLDTANAGSGGNQSKSAVFFWRLLFNPGLSGVPSPTNIGKCSQQWAYTNTAAVTGLNGGFEILAGYSKSDLTTEVKTALNFLDLGSNIEYTDADKVVLVVKRLAAGQQDAALVASINFIEAL